MAGRTFVIGDIHGELSQLEALLRAFPPMDGGDKLVLLGDYLDRGPQSREVIELVRALPARLPADVIALRGNHEDAWLRVATRGWPEFIKPKGNGCLAALRSFRGQPHHKGDDPTKEELEAMNAASFFPHDVLDWLESLPYWHEDEHAIYVHAGLVQKGRKWLHPSDVDDPTIMLWVRERAFFEDYHGKRVVVGHTVTKTLPPEFSTYTPDDPEDLWAGEAVIAIDTGCGKGGFLTGIELPAARVYETRRRQGKAL